jgi:hypothetical protein
VPGKKLFCKTDSQRLKYNLDALKIDKKIVKEDFYLFSPI